MAHEFLIEDFLDAMNDIGRYGHEKYGEFSFHHRRAIGNNSRGDHPRTTSQAIGEHSQEHFSMYLRGESHDHFATKKHQLAAVAFNAMMEFFFANLGKEIDKSCSSSTGDTSREGSDPVLGGGHG